MPTINKNPNDVDNNPGQRHIDELTNNGHSPHSGSESTDKDVSSLKDKEEKVASGRNQQPKDSKEQAWVTSVGNNSPSPLKGLGKMNVWIRGNPYKSGGLAMGFVGIAALIIIGLQSLIVLPFLSFAHTITGVNFAGFESITNLRLKDVLIFTKATKSIDLSYTRLGLIGSAMSVNLDKQFAKNGVSLDVKAGGTIDGFIVNGTIGDSPVSKEGVKSYNEGVKKSLIAEGIPSKYVDIVVDPKTGIEVVKVSRPGLFHPFVERTIISTLHGGNRDVGKYVAAMEKRTLRKRLAWTMNPITKVDAKYRQSAVSLSKYMGTYFQSKFGSGATVDITTNKVPGDPDDPPEDPDKPTGDADAQVEDAKKGTLKGKVAGVAGLTVGLVCVGKYIYQNAATVNQARAQAPMIQLAGEFISAADKIKNGDADVETLGEWEKIIVSNTADNKSSWSGAASINYDQGNGRVGQTLPSELNPNPGADSTLGAFFDQPIIDRGCEYLESSVVQVISFALGPVAYVVEEGLFAIAQSAGFIDKFLALFYQEPYNLFQQKYFGAISGEIGNVASYLLDNQAAAAAAGAVLSPEEAEGVLAYATQDKILQDKNKSIAEKYLNPYNFESPASKAIVSIQTSKPTQLISNIPGAIFKPIGNILASRVGAADDVSREDVYYGIAKIGFDIDSLSNINENPYVNADEARKILIEKPEYIERLKRCNAINAVVSETELDFTSEEGSLESPILSNSIKPDADCLNSNSEPDFLKVRIAVLDTIIAKSYACVMFNEQGFQEYCDELIGTGAELEESGGKFRVATFNVLGYHHTEPGGHSSQLPDGRQRMGLAFDLLNQQEIGVAGLQEFEKEQREEFVKLAGQDWGIHPNPADYSNLRSPNSIIWRNDIFEEVEKGFDNTLLYFNNRDLDAPWVRLRHKASGQIVYFKNTHDPANVGGDWSQLRYKNAVQHYNDAINRIKNGEKVMILGDFNSSEKLRSDDRGLTRNQLTYCVITKDGKILNAYDTADGRDGTNCPTTNSKSFGIDHIYHSQDINVSTWDSIGGLYQKGISDHPIVYADVSVGAEKTALSCEEANPSATYWPTSPHPRVGGTSTHDIGVPVGTPVFAIKSGTVTGSYDITESTNRLDCTSERPCNEGLYSYGRVIKIDHGIPEGKITYAHLSKRLVEEGDEVTAGQLIALSGNSGNSFGAHLHLDFNSGTYETIEWLIRVNAKEPPCADKQASADINNKHLSLQLKYNRKNVAYV